MYPALISGEARAGWYSVGSPRRRADGEGAIRMRNYPDSLHPTHSRLRGIPGEWLFSPGPRGSADFFLAGAGVEGGRWGRMDGSSAGRKEAGASIEADRSKRHR